ncbi:MAG: GNAT family N-acetyltransferase [Bacilli bacterium]|nr:GNAT family N-acetyltransferase [Bacilli bacterium]
MVNICNVNDKKRIIELGTLINQNFSKVNNIEELIKENNIIGYYDEDYLVGFIIFNKLYEVIDLLYIVVDPIYRRKNIGSILLEYLINNFIFEKIILEVRCDNVNAIKLYKKYNFKIINIRKKYYENKDAYVMELIK